MLDNHEYGLVVMALVAGLVAGCDQGIDEGPVDFASEGARAARQHACAQDWETAARKGAAEETYNASTLWSVSPYQLRVPATGTGYVQINVDAPHYDWLLYTTADLHLDEVDGPPLELGGAVRECPELGLVEYGAHHRERTQWMLRMEGEGLSRARFYTGLAATAHSDPEEAGHAGHGLNGEADAHDH